MQIWISCTAALELLRSDTVTYVHSNDSVPQELNPFCKETTMLLSLIRMIQAFRDYQRNVAELSQLSDIASWPTSASIARTFRA